MLSSLSIIIPALNEEKNLENAVDTALKVASQYFLKTEVLIFDDGSTDDTGAIADTLAKRASNIRVYHHKSPENLGGCYWRGVDEAKNQFVIMVPGDNECGEDVLHSVFSAAQKAEIVVPYTANHHVRPLGRQILSAVFVKILNAIAHQQLKYYNGTVLHYRDIIRACPARSKSFAYQAEALVYLLRRGHSFIEVPIEISHRKAGHSKALRIKNLLDTGASFLRMAKNSFSEQTLIQRHSAT